MSTTYYLLLFLCISLHAACNARHLIPIDKKKKLENKPHLSIKIDDRNRFDSSLKKLNEGENNKIKSELVADSEKTKNRSRSTNKKVAGKSRVSSQAESLVSISWRVPHKNKKKNQSRKKHISNWFTLDYSPPKTHPPSHN